MKYALILLTCLRRPFLSSRMAQNFTARGSHLLSATTALGVFCYDYSKALLRPYAPATLSDLVILNLLLQTFDGVATYYGLSLGVGEGNPLIRTAMLQWGVAEALFTTKGAVCLALPIFLFIQPRRLSVLALLVIATAYLALSFVPWLAIFFSKAQPLIWV